MVQLLQNGAEPNILVWGNKTALHRAVEMQHIPLTKALVVHGVEVTAEHLIEATHHGNHHLLKVLLIHHKEVKMDEISMVKWPSVSVSGEPTTTVVGY